MESSFAVKKRVYMQEQNGDKLKAELLQPNNNDEMQEFTL
jgi:hypothetical protein